MAGPWLLAIAKRIFRSGELFPPPEKSWAGLETGKN